MPDKPALLGSSRRSQSPVNTLKKSMTPLKSPGMLDIATANCSLLICCPISRQFINRIKAELKFGKSINSFVSVKTQANWKVCCFVEWGAQRFQTPQCVLLLKVVQGGKQLPAGLLKNCWHSWQDTVLRYFYGGVFSFNPKFLPFSSDLTLQTIFWRIGGLFCRRIEPLIDGFLGLFLDAIFDWQGISKMTFITIFDYVLTVF